MPTIDTTRPLFVAIDGNLDDKEPVPFITETSEGHILVGSKGGASSWFIFTKKGEFVRSEIGSGSRLVLVNEPQVVERYVSVGKTGGTSGLHTLPGYAHENVAHIRLTLVDGIVTGVSLATQNREPWNV